MADPPIISVVIATYGRPTKLKRCLEGLARQRYPPEKFEVVVVDDGSPDPVQDALGKYLPSAIPITILRQDNKGPGSARNTGVRAARGEWIAFIDDDCVPSPHWLASLESVLAANPNHLVGGRVLNGYPNNLFDTASWVLLAYLYDYMRQTAEAPRFFATMNMGVPREDFLAIGGFDHSNSYLAEDRELCDRWTASGRKMIEAPEAAIKHYHGLTLIRFWRQHSKYGRGARRFHLARSARREEAVRLEPMKFYWGLLLAPMKLRKPLPWRLLLSCCMVLSQVAMVAGYFGERIRA